MYWPSKTLIFSGIFLAYILHSIYNIVDLFLPPTCTDPGLSQFILVNKTKASTLTLHNYGPNIGVIQST